MDTAITTRKPRRKARATVKEVEALKRTPGRHSVGDGLILVVTSAGTASWIARVTDPTKRRRDIGLGPYPRVSLKEAGERADAYRKTVRDGIDPLVAKRAAAVGVVTFKAAAEQFHRERERDFRKQALADQWFRTLEDYSFPKLGSLPIDQVTGPLVVQVVKPILQEKKFETARRVLRRIAAVVAWSVGHGHREHELPMASIRNALGKTSGEVVRHPSLPYAGAPDFLATLRSREGMAALALELTILTAVRSGEARGAHWAEIDLEARTWTIPAGRMKSGAEHIVPLSDAAVALLRRMEVARGQDGLVFPSSGKIRPGKTKAARQPLSDVALSKVQKSIAPNTTVHGWRSTFRTWCAEMVVQLPGETLAHTNPNQVEARYRRTNYLDLRRPLMEAWAAYVGGDAEWEEKLPEFRAAKVHKIGQAA